MTSGQTAPLRMPSFLHGTYRSVQQKAKREGMRCGEQYLKDSTFPAPVHLLEVPRGEVVLADEVVDFQHERPSWRLYMVLKVKSSLYDALEGVNSITARDAYEAFFGETAWGALFFAIAPSAPVSAERTARRLEAVLRFWEPLVSVRYLFKKLGETQTLEEVMVASCGWALEAWCPEEEGPVRERLGRAAERMARATREDCIQAILRQMPQALRYAERDLKHRQVLADPAYQRERLTTLDARSFERVSAASTSGVLETLHDWDHELGLQ